MAVQTVEASDRQREFLWNVLENDAVDTVAYGGARYGGKTFSNCLAAVLCCLKWPRVRVLMLRRVMKSAEENLGDELDAVHTMLGFPDRAVRKLISKQRYEYPNGSRIQLGYCRLEDDWEVYKGSQYHFLFLEEATQFRESQFDGLRGSCRSSDPRIRAKKVLTTNPDGVGMPWVKKRMINPRTREEGVVFIQSRVRDCLPTLERDPGYVMRELRKLPKWQQKQWEDGDWDAVEGQFWVLNPTVFVKVEIPEWAEIHAGVDAGYWPDAFAVVWLAKWTDFSTGRHRIHAFRDLKRHRLNLMQQAQAVREVEESFDWPVKARWADPAAWKRVETDQGLSTTTAHMWAQNGMTVSAAFSNTRVGGWNLKRTLMDDAVYTCDPDGCPNLYAEMVGSVHGKASEDMDNGCEDHCQDAERYGIVSTFAGGYARRGNGEKRRGSRRAEVLRLAQGGYAG